ncbi:hypothetical protein TNCV_2459791 [Trichonephila clavipes]|nr:hypothetical protein TNCV_2459791 [Trichonephila clavipes]
MSSFSESSHLSGREFMTHTRSDPKKLASSSIWKTDDDSCLVTVGRAVLVLRPVRETVMTRRLGSGLAQRCDPRHDSYGPRLYPHLIFTDKLRKCTGVKQ